MLDWAETAERNPDSKAQQLLAWLEEVIRPDGKWSNQRVIIFTEYRATQKWLYDLLANRGFAKDNRLMTMYGGINPDEREQVKAAFQANPEVSNVRILLATDAASEGLDLQNYCSNLIHYEIPWNPNRMEQRNGRIDRHGQKAQAVKIYHFVGKNYAQSNTQGSCSRRVRRGLRIFDAGSPQGKQHSGGFGQSWLGNCGSGRRSHVG